MGRKQTCADGSPTTVAANGYLPAYELGAYYADLGEKEQAFRWLNTAYKERNYDLLGLRTDFRLDPLRSDPRFSELVRRIGLLP
jgi:hypothetical protein